MFDRRSVGVVIPAYNEGELIGSVIETIPDFVDRVYVVDDASTDNTWAEISEFADRDYETRADPRIISIRHQENLGAGGAVKTGYRRALADGMAVIAVMDGDGQMDPTHLDRLVAPVAAGDVTYAKGNRLHERADRTGMPPWRLFGNVLLTMLTRIASGYWDLADPQNGYTVISREGLESIDINRLYDDYGFLNHLLIELNLHGERIADVAHPARYGDETSGIRYRTFVPGLSGLLLKGFVSRLVQTYVVKRFHPVIACYGIAPIVAGVGLLGGGYALASPTVNWFLGGMVSFIVLVLAGLLLVLATYFDVSENADLVIKFGHDEPQRIRSPHGVPVPTVARDEIAPPLERQRAEEPVSGEVT